VSRQGQGRDSRAGTGENGTPCPHLPLLGRGTTSWDARTTRGLNTAAGFHCSSLSPLYCTEQAGSACLDFFLCLGWVWDLLPVRWVGQQQQQHLPSPAACCTSPLPPCCPSACGVAPAQALWQVYYLPLLQEDRMGGLTQGLPATTSSRFSLLLHGGTLLDGQPAATPATTVPAVGGRSRERFYTPCLTSPGTPSLPTSERCLYSLLSTTFYLGPGLVWLLFTHTACCHCYHTLPLDILHTCSRDGACLLRWAGRFACSFALCSRRMRLPSPPAAYMCLHFLGRRLCLSLPACGTGGSCCLPWTASWLLLPVSLPLTPCLRNWQTTFCLPRFGLLHQRVLLPVPAAGQRAGFIAGFCRRADRHGSGQRTSSPAAD